MIKNEHTACSGRSHLWCHEQNVGYLCALFDGAVLWKYNTFEMSVNFHIAEREKTGGDDNCK